MYPFRTRASAERHGGAVHPAAVRRAHVRSPEITRPHERFRDGPLQGGGLTVIS
ncbi:unnamed protein product [[Actinomadura] parvosata subsp. kistnae]|nr:unnamed protein product [Actinomadura parvosata subsp. kistnae]